MRVIYVFVLIFAIFAFLTIGSLMVIVSLQVLTMEDALLKVQELYENPWQSLRMGASGIAFLFVGLVFAKILVKEMRSGSDVVLYGKWGYVSVSIKAIESLVRKGLGRFQAVREARIKTDVDGTRLKIRVDLTVSRDWDLSTLTNTIQNELAQRISRLVGEGVELEIAVHIGKIIEQAETVQV